MITYWIDPSFGEFKQRIGATIQQILEMAGWRSHESPSEASATLLYGGLPGSPRSLACAGLAPWRHPADQQPMGIGELIVPDQSVLRTDDGEQEIDLIFATYFFLTGQHEKAQEILEEPGVPGTGISVWRLDTHPIVNDLANRVKGQVEGLVTVPARPRWPEGKQWAVCLSHDCDRPYRFRPIGFVRDMGVAGGTAAQKISCLGKAFFSTLLKPFVADPYYESWESWLRFESEMGIHGVYYIGTWSRWDQQSNERDLPYLSTDPVVIRLANLSLEKGAEIGLHSGIQAWRHPGRFQQETDRFRTHYGVDPKGFRGHYWSLDPENPESSHKTACLQTHFKYDSSFGMNLVSGFRRGAAYPFRTFEPCSGEYTGLIELPPVIMDGALHSCGKTNPDRLASFIALGQTVKKAEGLLMLDWHSDSLDPSYQDNLASRLLPTLRTWVDDSSCWFATGSEIAAWSTAARWETRAAP